MPVSLIHRFSPPEQHCLLDDLMAEVFGFTFAAWRERGLWTDDYTACTIIENGVMLANVSICEMTLLVGGKKRSVLQIGAVATRPERRGQGLSHQIFDFILARYPNMPMFLCPNSTVMNFYPRFGFRLLRDRQPQVRVSLENPSAGMVPLSVDDPQVSEALAHCDFPSRILDCTNAAPIRRFHLLYEYPGCIYAIPALQSLVVAEQAGSVLTLVDLFASRPLAFTDLLPHLGFSGVDTIRFGFNPDRLAVDCEWVEHEDSAIFVRSDLLVRTDLPVHKCLPEGDFILPLTLKT